MKTIHTYINGRLEAKQGAIVREFPLVLHVNGREIATLIASPHDLRFLVAGFLRLQGFVSSVDDFHMLSVCDDFGIANVRIKGELPERLKPILTSGCGTGVTFSLPGMDGRGEALTRPDRATRRVAPTAIFRLMDELAKRADNYKSHGGIHSAAVGDADGTLLLCAEDLGRHNTLDRIAGEALLKGIDLKGKILVTSGRVSTEMAGKCAHLGLAVIASRTSPTDMAVKMCEDAGITLIGYVRGGKFCVYAHPERLATAPPVGAILVIAHEKGRSQGSPLRQAESRIPDVTGVILAGGQSSRMGSNKALLPYKGGRFIEAIYRQLSEIFDEVILVTNNPEQYDFLPCRKVSDLYPGMGALAGIHAGLHHAANQAIFAVACDMPYLNSDLIRHLASQADAGGVLIPESQTGLEPLHAVYGKGCLTAIEDELRRGERRIVSFFARATVRRIAPDQLALFDPDFAMFRNINTPEDYYRLREGERSPLSCTFSGCSFQDQP
ncbi:MAG: formate dehydrogenase accessory sulfurtransferase FdhD [Desulfuromonadales bacterium]|nr:MAG: formate dehydrogenase accessory sulfurtransferase FdhD [Desulfuromonadales bacterium]